MSWRKSTQSTRKCIFSWKSVKLSQDELFSIFKRAHYLRMHAVDMKKFHQLTIIISVAVTLEIISLGFDIHSYLSTWFMIIFESRNRSCCSFAEIVLTSFCLRMGSVTFFTRKKFCNFYACNNVNLQSIYHSTMIL